jgi:hypothetical protein
MVKASRLAIGFSLTGESLFPDDCIREPNNHTTKGKLEQTRQRRNGSYLLQQTYSYQCHLIR